MTTPSEILDKAGDETEAFDCSRCRDTHVVETERGRQACTSCPSPCDECRGRINGGGFTAYCAATPCPCHCHVRRAQALEALTRPSDSVPKPKADQPSAEEPDIVRHLREWPNRVHPAATHYLKHEEVRELVAYIDSLKPAPVPSAEVVERVAIALATLLLGWRPYWSGFAALDPDEQESFRAQARAALSAIPQPAEPKPDPWTRLGLWLADRKKGMMRQWEWSAYEDSCGVVLFQPGSIPREGVGPTLDAALIAALTKVGA